jgi:hypothetical protein
LIRAARALPWVVPFAAVRPTLPRGLALTLLTAAACSSSPSGPAVAPSASAPAPVAPAPSVAPSASAPPSAAGCRYGPGTLDTTCARRTQQFEPEVNAAIDRLADRHPEYFDTSVNQATGEWRVLRPREYLDGVVGELQRVRFCAETDTVSVVALKNGSEFSETYDVLLPTGHVRRGNRAYQETCSPPSFPVVPAEAIAYVRVAFYSITCEEGITPPRNGENVLPLGCRGFVTATPKQRNNQDVPHHIIGRDVAWRLEQSGDVVNVHDDAANAFNKMLVGRNPGRYSLCAISHGIEGCQHAEVVPATSRSAGSP